MNDDNSSAPEWVFLTDPGCDSPLHREDLYDVLYLIAKLPGWTPERKRLRCGCTLIPLVLEATRRGIDPDSLTPHVEYLRNFGSADPSEGRQS